MNLSNNTKEPLEPLDDKGEKGEKPGDESKPGMKNRKFKEDSMKFGGSGGTP